MRVGLNLPQYEIDFAGPGAGFAIARVVGLARVAEDAGIDDLWVSDHPFVVGPDGVASGALEPMTMLGALAAATGRIGLGTLVLASTMRLPAVVGSMARTLPASRLTIGAGAGWYRPEHRAYGVPLGSIEQRASRMTETLGRVRASGARALAGGVGEHTLAAAARAADVWNAAWDPAPEAFRRASAALDRACEGAGRDPATLGRSVGVNVLVAPDHAGIEAVVERMRTRAPFLRDLRADALRERIVCGTPDDCAERIAAYRAGEVVVTLALRDDPEMLEIFAGQVAPKLRSGG